IDEVFALITDFNGYSRWLGGSSLYNTTTNITENPVKLGTRYTDHGKLSVMHGSVTAYEPPNHITFTQKTTLAIGTLTLDIHYQLSAQGMNTRVGRTVDLHGTGVGKLTELVLPSIMRPEEMRVLEAMKAYLEKGNA